MVLNSAVFSVSINCTPTFGYAHFFIIYKGSKDNLLFSVLYYDYLLFLVCKKPLFFRLCMFSKLKT